MSTDRDKPELSGSLKTNSGEAAGTLDRTIGFNQPEPAAATPMSAEALRPLSPNRALEPEDAAPAPKRSRHARNRFVVFFNFLVSSAVFATLLVLVVLYFGKNRFLEPGPLEAPRSIVVAEGSSLATISTQLAARGIVDSEMVFRLGVRGYRAQSQMQAGEYAFKPSMSMYEVMETLRSGKGIIYKVSLPEGLTSFQIMKRIEKNDVLVGDMPDEIPAEGSLMPDTYPFQRGMSRKELIEQMVSAQKNFLAKVWERRVSGLPISTPEEMVVLASIVEKETAKADERPHVASVFVNRLNLGMKLQSDPTIIYGLFGGEGKPKDRPIYRSDITKATDYNTYVIDALPPGPISNPGRASLEAVANPSKTDDLFFVADGTGGHVFAKTLAEHNANVVRWRAIEKRMKAETEKKAAEQAAGTSEDANQAQSN
ncbi:MAG: endolytic transglycosylase MltG [Rhizobiaceae bacterium]|nr:endolytic transglycosylase MltG [Rhizobiaceae bacterium]